MTFFVPADNWKNLPPERRNNYIPTGRPSHLKAQINAKFSGHLFQKNVYTVDAPNWYYNRI